MRSISATAFLPAHEVAEAVCFIRDDMEEVHAPAVEVVDWFVRYYVGPSALYPPTTWVILDPNHDR